MFKQRVITGVVYVGFILWMIFSLPPKGFDFVLAVITCYGMAEWVNLIQIKRRWVRILLLDAFILALISVFWFESIHGLILGVGVFLWACVLPFLIWQQSRITLMKMNVPTLMGLGTIMLLAMYIGMTTLMRATSPAMVLMLFLVPWIADTSAYLFGKLFGKHKMIPHISPGKTWEGLVGAVLGSMILLPLYAYWVLGKDQVSVFFFAAILILVLVSVIGDLFESYIKRTMGVKDSGNILPGHGGLLDRLDSLIAVAPCFMLIIQLGWI